MTEFGLDPDEIREMEEAAKRGHANDVLDEARATLLRSLGRSPRVRPYLDQARAALTTDDPSAIKKALADLVRVLTQ